MSSYPVPLCSRSVFLVAISNIKEVRMGKNTDVLRSRDMDCFSSERAFSIIYSEQYNTMDLIADTADEANIWVTGLTCLLSKNRRGTLNIHPDYT